MRRGFFILEAIVGLILLTAIAGAMVLTLHAREEVNTRVRDRGQALHRAEAALIAMQNHQRVASPDIQVEPAGEPRGRLRWIRVTASAGDQKVQLIGMAPVEDQP